MNSMSNVWKLYAVRFFHNLIPAYVIERLFYQQRGMTIQMVVYTEIIYALTVVLLEIPTGIIADKFGRKKMFVLNALLGCSEFFILIFSNEFWHFAVVAFLAGVAGSALSGSENALLYDSLLSNGSEKSFEKCIGRLNAFDFSATLIEPGIKTEEEGPIPLKQYFFTSLNFFNKNPGVCIILMCGMVTGAAINFIDEFWQLYINKLGIPLAYFGLLSTGFMFLRVPGNLFAHALKKLFSYRALMTFVVFIFAAGFLWLSSAGGYQGLASILMISMVSGIIDPLASGYLHHRIDSSMRATLDSFRSLGLKGAITVIGLGFGYFCGRSDILGGYGFIAFVCCTFFVFFVVAGKKIIM